jgi:hypothetical protein
MDTVNELGRELNKTRNRADRALKTASPEYGMAERARDIFDPIVPYTMSFRVPRKGMQIRANMQFEYPPPNSGAGGCCGDCYCAICERFLVSEITSTSILLNRPYVPGSVRVYNGEIGISVGVTESDPDAGILYLDACLGSDTVTICYVYRYSDVNCSYYDEMTPFMCVTDTFTRSVTDGWGTSDAGIAWGYLGNYRGTDVANGEGHISVDGNTFATLITSVSSGFVDMVVSMRMVNGTTGQVFFAADSASTDSFGLSLALNGSLTLEGPVQTNSYNIGITPDEQFFARIIVTSATSFDAYVWRIADTEPTTPTLSLVDMSANFTGLSSVYIGGSGGYYGNYAKFDVYVDSLDIAGVNACETVLFDTFTRTIGPVWDDNDLGEFYNFYSGWGTSDFGLTWDLGAGVKDERSGVSNGAAYILWPAGGSYGASSPTAGFKDTLGPWASANGFLMTLRFKLSYVPAGTSAGDFFQLNPGVHEYPYVYKANLVLYISQNSDPDFSGIWIGASGYSGPALSSAGRVWEANVWYTIKWEVRPGSLLRAKVWADQQESEPASWDVEATGQTGIVSMATADWFFIQCFGYNSMPETLIEFDYLSFT